MPTKIEVLATLQLVDQSLHAKTRAVAEGQGRVAALEEAVSAQTAAANAAREEQVLRLRFGIGERSDHTLEEVGTRFAVTRERIRQIEAKALRKLRHPSRARRLRGFTGS